MHFHFFFSKRNYANSLMQYIFKSFDWEKKYKLKIHLFSLAGWLRARRELTLFSINLCKYIIVNPSKVKIDKNSFQTRNKSLRNPSLVLLVVWKGSEGKFVVRFFALLNRAQLLSDDKRDRLALFERESSKSSYCWCGCCWARARTRVHAFFSYSFFFFLHCQSGRKALIETSTFCVDSTLSMSIYDIHAMRIQYISLVRRNEIPTIFNHKIHSATQIKSLFKIRLAARNSYWLWPACLIKWIHDTKYAAACSLCEEKRIFRFYFHANENMKINGKI